jgi:hypothetical protein
MGIVKETKEQKEEKPEELLKKIYLAQSAFLKKAKK